MQVETRGKGWWLEPPTRGGDSAPPCERIEGLVEEAVEEAVGQAHPKKLTATHEGVIIDARRKMAFTGHTASLAFTHAPATVHRPPHARQLQPPPPQGLRRSMQGEAAEARHHQVQPWEGQAH